MVGGAHKNLRYVGTVPKQHMVRLLKQRTRKRSTLKDRLMADSMKFTERRIMDEDSGVQYTPFITHDGRVGYECTDTATGRFEFLYFNPSNGSDDGVPNVFVYQGTQNDPYADGAVHHYTVLDNN